VHQRVGRKFVGQRGHRGVVVRRVGEAAPAKLAARRVERAARAARAGEPRQVGVASAAEQAFGRAAAQEAAPPNHRARKLRINSGSCGL
jgi:hypothetical protein